VFVDVHLSEAKMGDARDVPDYVPDLTLKLRDGGFVSIVRSGGEIVRPRPKADGTHRPKGIFIARGPDIESGKWLPPLDILAITPLILYCLGLPVPADLEGRVPTEVLRTETLVRRPVARGDVTAAQRPPEGDAKREASPEEREALIAQMKLLGYMD
jgi:hypothetical protein